MSWRTPVIRGCVLLMEAMWTYALVAFAVAAITDGGDPSFAGVCAVVLSSYAISRVLQGSELSLGVLRAWGAGLSFMLFYAIVRVDFFGDWRFWDFSWANDLFNSTEASMRAHVDAVFGVPMLWGFWIRGVLRGQETATFEDVVQSFGIGVLIMAFVQLFQGGLGDSPAMVGRIAVPFVAFGLFAIALAHSAQAETDRGRPFERTLLVSVGVSVLALAFLAAVVALFDLATGWSVARDGANALVDAGEAAGKVIAWPLMLLLDGIFAVLVFLRDLILGQPAPQQPQPQAGQQPGDCVQALIDAGRTMEQALKDCSPEPRELPEWVKDLVRVMIAVPIVGTIVLFTALLFTRFRQRRRTGELKESAYVAGRLSSDLSDLWHGLLNRLRPNIHFGSEHADPVRQLYFEVLREGEHRGVARRPAQTPDELAPSLDRTFHGDVPGDITRAFDDARYGARPPPEPEVRRLRERWQRLLRE
ncbi:MAG TPA: DUF4129 domain-containing protein [Dehalococcoidia bacterium]|nr:DUF4129 domain-containing protein [Dehalococcoidia bacterium]